MIIMKLLTQKGAQTLNSTWWTGQVNYSLFTQSSKLFNIWSTSLNSQSEIFSRLSDIMWQ